MEHRFRCPCHKDSRCSCYRHLRLPKLVWYRLHQSAVKLVSYKLRPSQPPPREHCFRLAASLVPGLHSYRQAVSQAPRLLSQLSVHRPHQPNSSSRLPNSTTSLFNYNPHRSLQHFPRQALEAHRVHRHSWFPHSLTTHRLNSCNKLLHFVIPQARQCNL